MCLENRCLHPTAEEILLMWDTEADEVSVNKRVS